MWEIQISLRKMYADRNERAYMFTKLFKEQNSFFVRAFFFFLYILSSKRYIHQGDVKAQYYSGLFAFYKRPVRCRLKQHKTLPTSVTWGRAFRRDIRTSISQHLLSTLWVNESSGAQIKALMACNMWRIPDLFVKQFFDAIILMVSC